MLKLSPCLHSRLTDRLIGILKNQEISTVSDFLRTDSNKLKQYLNIDLVELTSIKMEFWKLIGILPIDGFEHYIKLTTQSISIPTGISSLDAMLHGGLLPGNIVDVCGFSASGKTQLHTTIAINWSINQDFETFVIDTKGDFSGDRINRILLSRSSGFDADKRKRIMRNIKVEKCNSASDLIELIDKLFDQKSSYPKFKFLVIDSLPSLFFHYHGKKNILGYQKLAQFADRLRNLAVEHGIVVMTVNIETRSMVSGDENAIDDVERSVHDVTDRTLSPSMSEIVVPALGKHWKTICPLRLQIQKRYNATNPNVHASGSAIIYSTNERTIRILKSNQYPVDTSCVVEITNSGII